MNIDWVHYFYVTGYVYCFVTENKIQPREKINCIAIQFPSIIFQIITITRARLVFGTDKKSCCISLLYLHKVF